jgi:hypothetical protein
MNAVEPQPDAVKLRWYQYSLRTLLIAVTFILMCVAYAAEYGVGAATVFAALTLLVYVWTIRIFRRWKTLPLRQRIFTGVEGSIFITILAAFIAALALNPEHLRERYARCLERDLSKDGRFSSVSIDYYEGKKDGILNVAGNVNSDRDFDALQKLVLSYGWRKVDCDIYWDMTVNSSKRKYEGRDDFLFRSRDP